MRCRRDGFTLIELLVVMAVIAVLVGLLLPAVQKARESAARAKCENNLKQLGLALHGYENATGAIPAGGVTADGQVGSWLHAVLPYVEQKGLADTYDLSARWFDPPNEKFRSTPLKLVQCPSAPHPRTASGTTSGVPWADAACSDYKATAGLNSTILGIGLPPDTARQGLMRESTGRTRLAECSDGLANTFLLAESAGSPQRWRRGRRVMPDQPPDGVWAAKDGVTFQGRSHTLDGASSPGVRRQLLERPRHLRLPPGGGPRVHGRRGRTGGAGRAERVRVRRPDHLPAGRGRQRQRLLGRPIVTTVVRVGGVIMLAAAGCGEPVDDRKPVFEVAGKAARGGEPMAGAVVTFHPLADPDPRALRSHAVVGAGGRYRLTTYLTGDGAPAGDYAVTAYWPAGRPPADTDTEAEPAADEPLPPSRLPPAYADPAATPLRATVREQPNEIDFTLP